MTSYELHLLGLAWEEAYDVLFGDGRHRLAASELPGTDEEKLTAILHHLGVEVPERPSANTKTASGVSVRALEGLFTYGQWAGSLVHLRSLYAREPLAVLALLEGGAS